MTPRPRGVRPGGGPTPDHPDVKGNATVTIDRIPTTTCERCGRIAPADAPHACRGERREVLRDAPTMLPRWATPGRAG
jgi:hypothetical protein